MASYGDRGDDNDVRSAAIASTDEGILWQPSTLTVMRITTVTMITMIHYTKVILMIMIVCVKLLSGSVNYC